MRVPCSLWNNVERRSGEGRGEEQEGRGRGDQEEGGKWREMGRKEKLKGGKRGKPETEKETRIEKTE